MKCPLCGSLCGSPAQEQSATLDSRVFECAKHGLFGISGTAMAMGFEDMDAWKRASALDRAKTHMRPCDTIPVITSYHL